MKTVQTLEAVTRPTAPKRFTRGIFIAFLALGLALIIAGCGRQIPPYWPDMAASDGMVYVAQTNGQLFALQAEDGQVMWSYPTIERRGGGLLGGCSAPAPSDGPFFAAPAIGDGALYLGSAGEQQRSLFSQGENRSGLRVLNSQGVLQWEFRGTKDRTVAPPALAGDTVYLPSSDYNVYAIDINTRQARWVFETNNWVWATPLVVEDAVYIASMDHVLYAVQSETGRELWRFDRSASSLPAAPAYFDGTLYVGSLRGYVYAVSAENGDLVWEHQVDGGVWATPLVEGDAVYFGTLGGRVYALDITDGAERWGQSVGGEVRGTPAYVNGVLYYGCEDGQLYAFQAQDGSQDISPLGQRTEDTSIYTSPVFNGEYLFVVATDGQVFALDPQRGAVVWEASPLSAQDEEEN